MSLVRLIYASRMTEDCDLEGIQDVLNTSHKNNPDMDISGILCYDSAYFLQCLEGPQDKVNKLYNAISNDPRHTDVEIIYYGYIKDRVFGKWAMGFLKPSELDKETLQFYMGENKFAPYNLEGEQAMNFLVTIIAQEQQKLHNQAPFSKL